MTQKYYTGKPRNLREFAACCKNKTRLYKQIKDTVGVSMATAERWCKFYYKTDDELVLRSLSSITGIAQKNLFRRFSDED